jgi:hypothetical protein
LGDWVGITTFHCFGHCSLCLYIVWSRVPDAETDGKADFPHLSPDYPTYPSWPSQASLDLVMCLEWHRPEMALTTAIIAGLHRTLMTDLGV